MLLKPIIQQIVLLVEPSDAYGRSILMGVGRFAQTLHRWQLQIATGESLARAARQRPASIHGVIGALAGSQTALLKLLRTCHIPAVNTSNRMPPPGIPSVLSDDREVGRLAAEHLLAQGFHRFGYVGLPERVSSKERAEGFTRRLAEAGGTCEILPDGAATEDPVAELADWLRALPKPVGVLAYNDIRARHVSDACDQTDLRIPDDVALIGVDDDPIACHLVRVPISSVAPAFEEIGYTAARLLDRMLAGQPPPLRPVLIPPRGLVVRRSSDVLAVDDPALRRALAFVRERACEAIRVNDVARAARQSRRHLERRFRSSLGWTIHDEIRRVRLARGKQLLADTTRTVLDIALTVGFKDPKRFTVAFRHAYGRTPSAYRAAFRRA